MFSYDSDAESNLVTLTPISSKKIIDIHFSFLRICNFWSVGYIQGFYSSLNNKKISKWWMFEHFIQLECGMFSTMIQALNQIFKHSPFAYFLSLSEWTIIDKSQPFRTFISLKLKIYIYNFRRGNMSLTSPSWFNVWIIWEHPRF